MGKTVLSLLALLAVLAAGPSVRASDKSPIGQEDRQFLRPRFSRQGSLAG